MIIYFTNHTTLREVLYLIIFKIKTSLYVYFCRLPGCCRWMKTGKESRNISKSPPHPNKKEEVPLKDGKIQFRGDWLGLTPEKNRKEILQ